ncbi:hypothetical protein [Streptomyces sp. TRM49041]|uniref:hypothetical protein n=1 Tax=Streptomyces sp. TRM49041 TaxID=2603216 RepID=UPI0011F0355C|nr:hypothetical protein [Streptomyces sp. TRM49041]
MPRKSTRLTAVLCVGVAALGAFAATVTAVPAQAHGARQPEKKVFTTWATDVNARVDVAGSGSFRCPEFPSPANCPKVTGRSQPGDRLEVTCQTKGQTVGGNPYWVYVDNPNRGFHGWTASYYISHPDNRLPGVPQCYGP